MKKRGDNASAGGSQQQIQSQQSQPTASQTGNKIQIAPPTQIAVQGQAPPQSNRPGDAGQAQGGGNRRQAKQQQPQDLAVNPEIRNVTNQGQQPPIQQQMPPQNTNTTQQNPGQLPAQSQIPIQQQHQIPPQMQMQQMQRNPSINMPNGQPHPIQQSQSGSGQIPPQQYRYPPGQMPPQGQYPPQGQPGSYPPPMQGGVPQQPPHQYPAHQMPPGAHVTQQQYPSAQNMYPQGQQPPHMQQYQQAGPPGIYPQGQQQQMLIQMQKFDQSVISFVQTMNVEKVEIAGIQVEMPKTQIQHLQKNYTEYLKRASPQDKLSFLENTLLKRKSLINKSSKRYKAIQKKQLKLQQKTGNQRPQVKCPVYKCFKPFDNDDQLLKHYNEQHQDLKALGLDLVSEGQSLQSLASGKSNLKGKITNTLLTQTLMIALQHKEQIRDLLKELNEEVPIIE